VIETGDDPVSNVLEQLVAGGAGTVSQRRLMALEDLSINLLVALYRQGEIDSVIVGERLRRVVIASYLAYLRRRQLGIARDEGERQAAIESYRRSLTTKGAENAARARTGITPETRARGRRKVAALHEEPRSLSPQPRTAAASKPPAIFKDSNTTA
jgi:hypothetical protein